MHTGTYTQYFIITYIEKEPKNIHSLEKKINEKVIKDNQMGYIIKHDILKD